MKAPAKRASGKPQGQKQAPWAARGPKKTSGTPMGQTGAPWAARGPKKVPGKPMGQTSAPVVKTGGKAPKQIRSSAKLGNPSHRTIAKSVRKSKGY